MIAINLKGPFLCTRASLPDMLRVGWGRIVNISSSSTQLGIAGMAHYVSAKSGVNGLTKSLAKEYAGHGITVKTIPRAISTRRCCAPPSAASSNRSRNRR